MTQSHCLHLQTQHTKGWSELWAEIGAVGELPQAAEQGRCAEPDQAVQWMHCMSDEAGVILQSLHIIQQIAWTDAHMKHHFNQAAL